MFKLTVRLSDSLVERAKIRAIRERLKLQEVIARALDLYLKTPRNREEEGR